MSAMGLYTWRTLFIEHRFQTTSPAAAIPSPTSVHLTRAGHVTHHVTRCPRRRRTLVKHSLIHTTVIITAVSIALVIVQLLTEKELPRGGSAARSGPSENPVIRA